MGRHSKPAHCLRSERIELRLTKDEAHELFMRSIKAGVSTSDFIRKSALGSDAYMAKAEPSQAILIAQIDDLNKTGLVLGQIVRSGKYANSIEQTELLTQALLAIKTLSIHLIEKLSS